MTAVVVVAVVFAVIGCCVCVRTAVVADLVVAIADVAVAAAVAAQSFLDLECGFDWAWGPPCPPLPLAVASKHESSYQPSQACAQLCSNTAAPSAS